MNENDRVTTPIRISIAADHGEFELKELLAKSGIAVTGQNCRL